MQRVLVLLIAMDPFFHASGSPKSCRWCGIVKANVVFEDIVLCENCYVKAVSAKKRPSLCNLCKALFADKKAIEALTSEEGFTHGSHWYFGESTNRGCPLCRIFLLQDSNPEWERSVSRMSIFAETSERKDNEEGCIPDINGIYFWSEPDQYRLSLSVAAESGELKEDPSVLTTLPT